MERKIVCNDWRCGWHGMESEMLTAPNPFVEGETISACPKCKDVNCLLYACDEHECWDEATCGTPTPDGYRSTCGKHRPNN